MILTPVGPLFVNLAHAGPQGQVVQPDAPETTGFRPPTIFAAPLPVGSGARALGQAGAFTAVADDATAASWNPAGLTQLEHAEASVVYRFSAREDRHQSSKRDLVADRDRYNNDELNYLSAVIPFRLNHRNAVFSLNYQEAYDFTQVFSARFRGGSQWSTLSQSQQSFQSTNMSSQGDAGMDIEITTATDTLLSSRVDQLLSSSLLSNIDFIQKGSIDAISPAFAMELHPRFSIGGTINLYTDGASRGNPICSTMQAGYSGESESITDITEVRDTSQMFDWTGVAYLGRQSDPVLYPFSGSEGPIQYSDTNRYNQTDVYTVDGVYREENETDQFYGGNATLGLLWVATDRLTVGAAADLPWTGYGKQTKRIEHEAITFNSNGTQVAKSRFNETQRRDVEYTFPLYWSVGALWRWSDRFYSSMDVSRTYWSDFSYKADGEERINPLNGQSVDKANVEDCWSVRFGSEYLCMLSWTELPIRGGIFWEQRPAVGSPDEYWGITLGSGISLGTEPSKVILDVAYSFERAENVMGSLLPEQGVSSDSDKHQLFVSAIWHF